MKNLFFTFKNVSLPPPGPDDGGHGRQLVHTDKHTDTHTYALIYTHTCTDTSIHTHTHTQLACTVLIYCTRH